MNASYLIPECNLAELEARVEKLNRRCKRLGVAPIALAKKPDHARHQVSQLQSGCEIGGPATRLVWRKLDPSCRTIEEEKARCERVARETGAYLADAWEPTGRVMLWWSVEVTGEAPALNGWTFVAVLEPLTLEDGGVENFVQCVPGLECPAEYRTTVGRCDHCRAARRRNQTFVVRSEAGGHKCVGRQCLKDFLGYHADPHALAGQAELLAELGALCGAAGDEDWLEGEGGGGGRGRDCWDLVKFLTVTACRVRLFGWLSRSKAYEDRMGREATADHVLDLMEPPFGKEARKEWEAKWEKHVIEDADKQTAEAAVEWAKSLPASEVEANDYLANVNLVARVGAASTKTAGVAASILVAYQKAMEREINRQREAARPESHHVGEVGKRIELMEVTCERLIRSEGNFGVTGIHKLTDAAGNDLVWFASEGAGWITEGAKAFISATVKQHGEFKGRKQTVLTRVTKWTEEGLASYRAKQERKAAREAKKAAKEAAKA